MASNPRLDITDHLFWSTDLGLPMILMAVTVCYILMAGLLRYRSTRQRRLSWHPEFAFLLAMLSLYITLASPIDYLGERYLFSVHMLQHVLLMYPVAMLIVLGLPNRFLDPGFALPGLSHLLRLVTHPIVAGSVFNIVFAMWHVPGLYEWALRDRLIHNLEHVSILGSAILMWWPVLSTTRRLPPLAPGAQILYLLALGIVQLPVFAYVTFSPDVLYPTYEAAARLTMLTPLHDQQLGGIVMKIAGMGVFFALMTRAFWLWVQAERLQRSAHPRIAVCASSHSR